jgi:hypothetical protein
MESFMGVTGIETFCNNTDDRFSPTAGTDWIICISGDTKPILELICIFWGIIDDILL